MRSSSQDLVIVGARCMLGSSIFGAAVHVCCTYLYCSFNTFPAKHTLEYSIYPTPRMHLHVFTWLCPTSPFLSLHLNA